MEILGLARVGILIFKEIKGQMDQKTGAERTTAKRKLVELEQSEETIETIYWIHVCTEFNTNLPNYCGCNRFFCTEWAKYLRECKEAELAVGFTEVNKDRGDKSSLNR